jgi:hypothetical protein
MDIILLPSLARHMVIYISLLYPTLSQGKVENILLNNGGASQSN